MSKGKKILLWVLALVLMLGSAVYQRMTGPTHPKRVSAVVSGIEVKTKLERSYDGDDDMPVVVSADSKVKAKLIYKRYPTNDEWTTVDMKREGEYLKSSVPHQAPAGKVMYNVILIGEKGDQAFLSDAPVVTRYKGKVPGFILYPHVLFMFIAMVFSLRTGITFFSKEDSTFKLALITTLLFIGGGFILGPIVQKYAFGEYWTGFPFGTDLTDNKTAASLLFWVIALWRLKVNPNQRAWALLAAIVMFGIYLIPHSMFGSQLDYSQVPQN